MIWRLRRRDIDLSQRGMIMGVLNVTPDSFSDGGQFFDVRAAVDHALALEADGAQIIDVGGESTRPGAEPVGEIEEMRRVVPVVESLRVHSQVLISVDTSKAAVAEAALKAGADIINDVTALQGDEGMAEVAIRHQAGVILMHMLGTPRTMQQKPAYEDVVREVGDFLRQRLAAVVGSGLAVENIALDPGIGFGKRPEDNRALLARLPELASLGRPLVVGVSRKSFLSWLGGAREMEERFWPGVALTSFCRERDARIFRVHEPKPHHEALRMTEAILGHV